MEEILKLSDKYMVLEDLSSLYDRYELPSQAICRNISKGFNEIYKIGNFDLIVVFTGDTLITDSNNFLRRYDEMLNNCWLGMVSIAVGQKFHSNDDDPINQILGGRIQNEDTTDFACCYFMVKGDFAEKHKSFADIKITNKFTSEQCLGDEMMRSLSNEGFGFDKIGILNSESPRIAYSYHDGIEYHSKTNGLPSR
jgi:hypothetical protein